MSENDGTFGMMGPYEGFVALHNDSILPLSAIRGGQEEKLSKENTMEDKRAEKLQRRINQYELLADLLTVAYKYSGVLTTDHIFSALDAAADILDHDLDEDVEDLPGGVEDRPQKMKPETPHVPVVWTEQTASFADLGPTPVTDDHLSHVHMAQNDSENQDDR